ncbi:uncharacterized protein [Argopecten irradians]|uniref:uncharacterized protein n=1 Tax=Argopecten irradians TaxID=31199 RepID=UPI00372267FA
MIRTLAGFVVCVVLWHTANAVPANREYTGQGHCEYKGQIYEQGEKWSEGCELTCSCENAFTGFFTCNKRTPCSETLTTAPPGCRLEVDPSNDCCRRAVCDIFIGR